MKILLTTDFSDSSLKAFEYIKEFSKEVSCELEVICVLEDVATTNSPYTFASSVIDASGIMEQSKKEADTKLTTLCEDKLSSFNYDCEVVIAKNSVAEAIISTAKEKNVDLIIMASQGRSGLKKTLLGSIAEKVLRQSRCPVLLVPLSRES